MKPAYLVTFDYETTSKESDTTRGVQFAATGVAEGSGVEDVLFNEITDPEVGINHEAAAIHGITPEMVAGKRLDIVVAKEFAFCLDKLSQSYDVILAGHNSWGFDLPIAERLSGKSLRQFGHIDTLIGAARLFPDAPNHRLSVTDPDLVKKYNGPGLTQTLGLGTGEGAHDALTDVRMVRALVDYYGQGLDRGYRQLADWTAEPRVLTTVHFGKHKGKHWRDVPRFYLANFICPKFTNPTPDLQATVWHWHKMRFTHA